MTYSEIIKALAPLESFPVEAFEPDAQVPESICGFVLSLAVIFNDFRSIALLVHVLHDFSPPGKLPRNPATGQRNGMEQYGMRLAAAIIHELLTLISKNKELLTLPAFTRVLELARPSVRSPWESLVSVALERPKADSFSRRLLMIRNKVGFHYDRKEILRGYEIAFRERKECGRPCLSGGTTFISTQFYFADAAAQAYFMHGTASGEFRWNKEFLTKCHSALYGIILTFIRSRGHFLTVEDTEP